MKPNIQTVKKGNNSKKYKINLEKANEDLYIEKLEELVYKKDIFYDKSPLNTMNNVSVNNINNSLVLESLAVILRQNQKDIKQNQATIESKGKCLRE